MVLINISYVYYYYNKHLIISNSVAPANEMYQSTKLLLPKNVGISDHLNVIWTTESKLFKPQRWSEPHLGVSRGARHWGPSLDQWINDSPQAKEAPGQLLKLFSA